MLSVRGFFDRLFAPIARRLDGVNPNALTLVSLTAGVGAGACFAMAGRSPLWYLAAGALVGLSGAADALDGLVARHFKRESAAGDFLDHFGDRIVEVCVLGGIALAPGDNLVLGLSVIVVTVLHSYAGAQLEATFGRRGHEGVGKAEQFVGLVIFAAVLAVFPDAAWQFGALALPLTTIFFVILGAATGVALAHRLWRARSLARDDSSQPRSRT